MMKASKFLIICLIWIVYSCSKKEEDLNTTIDTQALEFLNGNYTGNIYKWTRDWDSSHMNIVETYDTVLNESGKLVINVDSNSIKFRDVVYPIHQELRTVLDKDTIVALLSYATRPHVSLTIIKSQKLLKVWVSSYAPVGPGAYTAEEIYYKD